MGRLDFSNETAQKLDELRDEALIEQFDTNTYGSGPAYDNLVNAILDKRLKQAIIELTKHVKRGNRSASRLNQAVLAVTFLMVFISFLQLSVAIISIKNTGIGWAAVLLITVVIFISIFAAARMIFREFEITSTKK